MKKILAILVVVLFAAYPAVSQAAAGAKGHGAPVEVSGTIVLQHIISNDVYAGHGDDNTDAYKVCLYFDKQITEGIKAHVVVNADEFGTDNQHATDSNALKEAQIIFTGVADSDITIVAGKQEAPFGQDYSQFITGTETHHKEIDKVWGVGAVFGIEGVGSVTAAVANSSEREDVDVSLTDTTAFKFKADKLVDGLSVEASVATCAGVVENEIRTSYAGKYSINDLTLAVEQTKIKNAGYVTVADDETISLVSADYKIGNILLKANLENLDNNSHHVDRVAMYGVNYEFTDGVYAAIEAASIDHESGHTADDCDQVLVGLYAHF